MIYTIELFYQTGDSFTTEKATDRLAMGWNKIEFAQDALQRIYEHYAFVEYINDTRNHAINDTQFELINSKPWFYNPVDDPDFLNVTKDNIYRNYVWVHNLWVQDDNAKPVHVNAFWHGYFEHLEQARIVVEPSNNEKVFDEIEAFQYAASQINNL